VQNNQGNQGLSIATNGLRKKRIGFFSHRDSRYIKCFLKTIKIEIKMKRTGVLILRELSGLAAGMSCRKFYPDKKSNLSWYSQKGLESSWVAPSQVEDRLGK
jgi:hypothetical protein